MSKRPSTDELFELAEVELSKVRRIARKAELDVDELGRLCRIGR